MEFLRLYPNATLLKFKCNKCNDGTEYKGLDILTHCVDHKFNMDKNDINPKNEFYGYGPLFPGKQKYY